MQLPPPALWFNLLWLLCRSRLSSVGSACCSPSHLLSIVPWPPAPPDPWVLQGSVCIHNWFCCYFPAGSPHLSSSWSPQSIFPRVVLWFSQAVTFYRARAVYSVVSIYLPVTQQYAIASGATSPELLKCPTMLLPPVEFFQLSSGSVPTFRWAVPLSRQCAAFAEISTSLPVSWTKRFILPLLYGIISPVKSSSYNILRKGNPITRAIRGRGTIKPVGLDATIN